MYNGASISDPEKYRLSTCFHGRRQNHSVTPVLSGRHFRSFEVSIFFYPSIFSYGTDAPCTACVAIAWRSEFIRPHLRCALLCAFAADAGTLIAAFPGLMGQEDDGAEHREPRASTIGSEWSVVPFSDSGGSRGCRRYRSQPGNDGPSSPEVSDAKGWQVARASGSFGPTSSLRHSRAHTPQRASGSAQVQAPSGTTRASARVRADPAMTWPWRSRTQMFSPVHPVGSATEGRFSIST